MKVCKRHHVNCSLSIILGKQINKFSSPWHFKGRAKKKKAEKIPPKTELLTSVISLLILALAWAVAKRIIVSKVRAVTGIVYKKKNWMKNWMTQHNTVFLLYFVLIERERKIMLIFSCSLTIIYGSVQCFCTTRRGFTTINVERQK